MHQTLQSADVRHPVRLLQYLGDLLQAELEHGVDSVSIGVLGQAEEHFEASREDSRDDNVAMDKVVSTVCILGPFHYGLLLRGDKDLLRGSSGRVKPGSHVHLEPRGRLKVLETASRGSEGIALGSLLLLLPARLGRIALLILMDHRHRAVLLLQELLDTAG